MIRGCFNTVSIWQNNSARFSPRSCLAPGSGPGQQCQVCGPSNAVDLGYSQEVLAHSITTVPLVYPWTYHVGPFLIAVFRVHSSVDA